MGELLRRIGERVRAERTAHGLTMKQAAVRAGISLRFFAQLEAGRANIAIGRLAQVADALGVAITSLLSSASSGVAPLRLALIGLRGAGKSTIGRMAARELDAAFVELDEVVEKAAGLGLSEIFALHGESYYRRLEERGLQKILAGDKPVVLALSGGIVGNRETFALVKDRCTTVWLKARPDDHMKRVLMQGDRRPIANRVDAMSEMRSILAAREPLYAQADITIDTSRRTPERAVEQLVRALSRRRAARHPSGKNVR